MLGRTVVLPFLEICAILCSVQVIEVVVLAVIVQKITLRIERSKRSTDISRQDQSIRLVFEANAAAKREDESINICFYFQSLSKSVVISYAGFLLLNLR